MAEHEDIIKALECCDYPTDDLCCECCFKDEYHCTTVLNEATIDLIKRQQAEIERLTEEVEKLQYKLECLLCHSTGSKLSKSTYSLRTMEMYVNDYIEECCEEAQAEAIKEFADLIIKDICEQVVAPTPNESYIVERCNQVIQNRLKEMVGDNNA